MNNIPPYVSLTFMACVIACFGFIYYAVDRASGKGSNLPVIVTTFIGIWVFIITLLTLQGFFLDFISRPPRLFLFFGVIVLINIVLLTVKKSREFIGKMPITTLTYIHIIRVPVEIVLWWLFINGVVAESMTFQGLNYDILSGISAPFAGLFLVGMKSKSKFAAIIWNLLTLALLVNIVFRAIQATPYFYDVQLYDQPNIAVFHFPYIFLPLFIVPVVVFCHFASFYKLIFIPDEPED
ncbi:MAG: hypothetical protein RIC35_15095 [Marinoscillum sp.]